MNAYALDGLNCDYCLGTLGETADYYLDSTLKALVPVQVYDYPDGKVIREKPVGSIVGEVFSYVEKNGQLWWTLKEGGAVQHAKGRFDAQIAEYSGAGKKDELIKGANSEDGFGPFDQIGKLLKTVLIVAGIGVAGYIVFTSSKFKKLIAK